MFRVVVCDGPGSRVEKLDWAHFTGVPVLDEGALEVQGLLYEDVLAALEASGNRRCVLVPQLPLTDSNRADFIDRYGDRVQFQWFHLPPPAAAGNPDA